MVIDSTTSGVAAEPKFQLVGGDLCLDFANTVGGRRGGIAREKLHGYNDFLAWCRQAGIVSGPHAATLARKAGREPAVAVEVLARATQLRESIYGLFAAAMQRRKPPGPDLDRLNSELAKALCRLRVAPGNGPTPDFGWSWAAGTGDLDAPLGPIARAAADLLTDRHKLAHVRQCGGDNCGWLFLDSTRNHSRRWCDMRDCGNRAKVRRHRLKLRED